MSELTKSGVEFHSLADNQLAQWHEAGGHHRLKWDISKTSLAGSMDVFANLEEAAGTMGRHHVHDTGFPSAGARMASANPVLLIGSWVG